MNYFPMFQYMIYKVNYITCKKDKYSVSRDHGRQVCCSQPTCPDKSGKLDRTVDSIESEQVGDPKKKSCKCLTNCNCTA